MQNNLDSVVNYKIKMTNKIPSGICETNIEKVKNEIIAHDSTLKNALDSSYNNTEWFIHVNIDKIE